MPGKQSSIRPCTLEAALRYPALMPQRSPTLEGFRTVFRRPALVLAEVAWRWTFGAAALFLLSFAVIEYLRSLQVTSGEQLLLRSRQPVLISQAIAQIFSGSAPRLVIAALIVVAALAIFWIVAGALGRAASVRSLINSFGLQETQNDWKLGSLLGLNFLRVALGLASAIAFLGVAIVAGFTSSPGNASPGIILLRFVPLACIVALLWSTLNWYLATAALFVIRDAEDTFGSIAAAVFFARSNPGPVFWSSAIFGLLRILLFLAASMAALFPMAFASVLPPGITALGLTLITLIYFALVDLLYVGRLAAYLAILTEPQTPVAPVSFPPQDTPQPREISPQLLDRIPASDDDILSDIPGLLPPPEPAS